MADGVQQDSYLGQMDVLTEGSHFNALQFMAKQVANGNWTIALVQVKKVNGGGLESPPTVDVQPMVNQLDGYGQPVQHGVISGIPVWRLQGGDVGAVIADPVAGDIGIMAVAMRDISTVVRTKEIANPGSLRTYDPADGVYVGSLLGKEPKQYVLFKPDGGVKIADQHGNVIETGESGVTMRPPAGKPVTVDGNLVVTQDLNIAGAIKAQDGSTYAGNLVTTGDVTAGHGTADQVGLRTHRHQYDRPTGASAPAPTNAPTPGT